MRILIIDNYDSFTFNLYQEIGEILDKKSKQFQLQVVRNDELTVNQIKEKKYDKIIISPGPGDPSDQKYFGVCGQIITNLGKTTPIMGVCLGMQGICHYFGGKIIRAPLAMHGKTSKIKHDSKGLFTDLPQDLEVMRYHSLVPDPSQIPNSLIVTAIVKNDSEVNLNSNINKKLNQSIEIMGLRHRDYPVEGIQFHPESFATEGGKQMLMNFIEK